mgnify:CR=1 FL=1
MKVEEKLTNKEKRAVIIRKYQQYLKLEKALSPNTLDAYMMDLQKLLHFLEGENIEIPDVTPDDCNALPQDSTTSVSIPVPKPGYSPESNRSSTFW